MIRPPLLALASALCLSAQSGDIPFARKTIDASGPRDPWYKLVGDLDGDGHPDIIVGGQSGPLVAYLWPDWKKVQIAAGGYNGVEGDTGDVDGDGDVDIVLGGLVWFENPRIGGGTWKAHRIDTFPAHDVRLADLDGDGKLDLVARDQSGFGHNAGNRIRIYRQDRRDEWTRRILDCPHGEGLKVADLNKDGLPDIVIAGRWYENPGDILKSEWKEHVYSTRWTHADVKVEVADVNGDGRPDIILAPAEPAKGKYRVSWFEAPADPRSGEWAEHVIADGVETVVHGLAAGDLNGDGHVDLVTSAMHQGAAPTEVIVWINQGRGKSWRKQVISDKGSHDVKVADFRKDGAPDIVGANHGGPYQPIELWENQSKAPATIRVHLFISGVVQGVSYRASTQAEAERLGGIAGWVRNLSDGRVEGVFQGPREKVEALLKWCHKGPPAARVDKIDVTNEKAADDLKGFEIKPTK